MFPRSPVALREWAVTCDALARGEQIFTLRDDLPGGDRRRAPGAGRDPDRGPTPADRASALLHEQFWLWPEWNARHAAGLTDPYRDRRRALDELRHRDGQVRLAYYATVEFIDHIDALDRLLALDGEHALNAAEVEARLDRSAGVSLLVLRVHRVPGPAARVGPEEAAAGPGPWIRLREPRSTEGAEPVLDGARFLAEKARLLTRAGSLQSV